MRIVRAALAVAVFSAVAVAPTATQVVTASGTIDISDPLLLAKIEEASTARTEGVPMVPVEVLTADQAGISVAVQALGGSVTGAVPGSLVQARVPVAKLSALANTPGARFVQYPRLSGRVPSERSRTEVQGTGTVGAEIGITGIGDWHDANLKGAGVKVGIVDYFDFTKWLVTENGSIPDANHQFCQDTVPYGLCTTPTGGSIVNDPADGEHGVAVAEIVKDMAPGAELFIASVGTTSDLQAAVNWFQSKGVTVITRSLGAPYDGPGDGTGPLDAVASSAVSKGMTWFNSAGNDALDAYVRRAVNATVADGSKQYVDFDAGVGVDTWFRIDGDIIVFDGVRWANDWYLPANQRTDYSLEFYAPNNTFNPDNFGDHQNPTSAQVTPLGNIDDGYWGPSVVDANQRTGANPLEGDDLVMQSPNTYGFDNLGVVYMRVRRNTATPVGTPDTLEVALSNGLTELDYYDTAGTAGKPVADSKNPGVVAVGAVDPPGGTSIGYYSSQGPTNDGRIKPDVTAPAGFFSQTYGDNFSGTSAASPVAAGMAAVLQGAGLAAPGEGTAALVKHFVADLGATGPDNVFGSGKIQLPEPPAPAASTTPGKYIPFAMPVRGLDTRAGTHVGPVALTGPYATQSIIDFDIIHETTVPDVGVSAVVINLTSVNSGATGYLQAYPYLRASNGGTSTLNISTAGTTRPNFAIVPVGVDGKISIYLQAGGNAIVDVLGYYLDGQTTDVADGRFTPLASPERWMDTRGQNGAPLPAAFSGTPRKANANETILVPTLATSAITDMADVEALIVNITAAGPAAGGYLQAITTGAVGATHSNVNYVVGSAAANTAIIPITGPGSMSVFTSKSTDIIVDVVGYITSSSTPASTAGLFVPITPGRAYNSRTGPAFTTGESRTVQLTGLTPAPLPSVPADAVGVSANLTVVNPPNFGFLTVYPGPTQPSTSNVNFAPGKTVANAALLALKPGGTVIATMSNPGHVLIDINGYFTTAST